MNCGQWRLGTGGIPLLAERILLIVCLIGGLHLAWAQATKPVLAIGAFEGSDATLAQQVRQQVVQTLSLSTHLQIADRLQARAVLQEQRLRESGLTGDQDSEPKDAPLAPANWLLVGRITSDEVRLHIELSCLDVRTGALLTGGVELVSGARVDWQMLAQRAAERMHRRLTGKTLPVSIPIEPLPDEGVPPSRNLRDYEGSPYRWHIDYVLEKGWMRLYPDGTFRPEEPVSACYFAALLQRLQAQLGTSVTYQPTDPSSPVSRGQAVILLAALSKARLPANRSSYLDIPDWAQGIVGWESARATPLTRERLAALLHNLMKAIEKREQPSEEGAP
ncbi:MAG: S-layer homology domain-containing protein [Armatimonadota bacterium]